MIYITVKSLGLWRVPLDEYNLVPADDRQLVMRLLTGSDDVGAK